MTGAVRLGDSCSGHDICSPRCSVTASTNVFINNLGAHRVGDEWEVHCTHDGHMSTGSPNVFANNLPLARIGDDIDCGSTAVTGSINVIVN